MRAGLLVAVMLVLSALVPAITGPASPSPSAEEQSSGRDLLATSAPPTVGIIPPTSPLPKPTASPEGARPSGLTRSGLASWYDAGPGIYAAMPGPWIAGRVVRVCAIRCVLAPVVTSCGCEGPPWKVIDLSPDLWSEISGATAAQRVLRGVESVTVEVLG